MLDKLAQIEKRYLEIESALSSPEVMNDMEGYKKYMKEYKNLLPVVEKYREYKDAERDIADAEEILSIEDDPELRALAEEQKNEAYAKLNPLMDELRILLLPKDPNDDKNVVIEIRGGAGGEEASLFAAVLYRMYNMYAAQAGFKTELLSANETELGGFKEVSFMVEGEGAYSRYKF